MEVIRHLGGGDVAREQQQIELNDKDSLVVFDLDKGRRTDKLEAAQLAGAVERQQALSRSVLAQQLSDGSSGAAVPVRPAGLFGATGTPFVTGLTPVIGRGGAVGFMPQVTVIPSGTFMFATGVVSADRRYVRITASPNFMQVGNVQTFTFAGPGQTVPAAGGAGGGRRRRCWRCRRHRNWHDDADASARANTRRRFHRPVTNITVAESALIRLARCRAAGRNSALRGEQPHQDALLDVHPVGRLRHDDALRTVNHFVGHFLAAVRG